jgi:hypothetical protein
MSNTSFADLRKSRDAAFKKLTAEVSKFDSAAKKQEDNRFWQAECDKGGNGYAVIRFLPAPSGEDLPFVRIWNHGFQGPGGWYIENSLTTIGQKDPLGELNSSLWNSGSDKDKEIARKQKRKLTYISNILVIKDTAHPENEGKVFLYRYGKKIFDKINALMNPEYEDETAANPFDFWNGCNFKLKIRTVEGYRNYDKSEFDSPSPVSSDDGEIEKIWKQQHSLQEFLDPKNFKSYAELKARLDVVLGSKKTQVAEPEDEDEVNYRAPVEPKKAAAKPLPKSDDDEDEEEFFKSLADMSDD